jgi:lysyl-tRNA synthetase, class II
MSSEHKSLDKIIEFRLEKLSNIKKAGFNPYPYKFVASHKSKEILDNSTDMIDNQVSVAGRIVALRKMGKASFAHIQDEDGRIQLYVKRDIVGVDKYNNLFKNFDLGDIIGVSGKIFLTRTEETTVSVEEITLLSKNIRPLPNLKEKDGESFNPFEDKENRYRNRHLDLIANPENREVFKTRAKIISSIRSFLDDKEYLEVETPVLQPIYGGASARPFTTHHNTLDQTLYLRISDELYLKRLIVGGFDRVYEIAKVFRNEGMDRNHNPEFTLLEYYQAYADVYDMMEITENMLRSTALKVGNGIVNYEDNDIDLNKPFKQASMFELLNKITGEDVSKMDTSDLFKLAKSNGLDVESKMNYGQLLDNIFGELVEPTLIQPTFVLDYPKEISPLAKLKRDSDGNLVERFELFIAGMEFANSFSELNDPIDQRERLESQSKLRELGDEEAQTVDENFLQAIEYGMPPTGGVGIGIDRLVMLLTGNHSIKDIILFPAMRPEE